MDPRGNIYQDDPENIPPEDKARLDGYLKARAEADWRAHMEHLTELVEEEKAREEKARLTDTGRDDG